MNTWHGSAAVCVRGGKLLMVKQGKPEEQKRWAIPSGGREYGESDESCCIREVFEETGYQVEVIRHLFTKTGQTYGIPVEVQYYEVDIIGGRAVIQDPDGLIYEIAWKSAEELTEMDLAFPEDREFLLDFMKERND
ncbi:MAG: NUDIX hydrolase [Tuberibacillus sp.]